MFLSFVKFWVWKVLSQFEFLSFVTILRTTKINNKINIVTECFCHYCQNCHYSHYCHYCLNCPYRVLSQFELLSLVTTCFFLCFFTIKVFEFCHHFSFWVLSLFVFLSFVTIWFFEFCHNFSFWVLSQFELLSFVTICVCEFCHHLSFYLFFYFFFTILRAKKIWWNFLCHFWHYCHNFLYRVCQNLSCWVWSQFGILSLITIWVFFS